jgi:hypothetical protein
MLQYNKKKKGETEVSLPLGKTWLEKPKTGNLLTKLLPGEK